MFRRKLRYMLMLAVSMLMMLTASQTAFADDWNVESISFTPESEEVAMSQIIENDNDGPLALNLANRGSNSLIHYFFMKGDTCTVTYTDGTSKVFRMNEVKGVSFAEFKADDGDTIDIEILKTDLKLELEEAIEFSADDLAAKIGKNGLTAEYWVDWDHYVQCHFELTVIEDQPHDCREGLRTFNKNDPICEAGGFSQECHRCQVCNKYYSDLEAEHEISRESVFLPALGHDFKEVEGSAIAATCTADGKNTDQKCTRCNVVKKGAVIPALGHEYDEWKTTTAATETAAGQQSHTCSRCGGTETKVIAQLAPTLAAVKIVKPKAAKKSITVNWKKVSKTNQKKIRKIEIQYSLDKSFKTGVNTKYAKSGKTSLKIKGLKSKKKYYVRIRAYTKSGNTVHVSKWSTVKYAKAK